MLKAKADAVIGDGRLLDRRETPTESLQNVPSDSKSEGQESLETLLRPEEKDLVRQLVQDLRSIRYGSIVLVLHEGRLVEVSKTIRVRRSPRREGEKESEDKR